MRISGRVERILTIILKERPDLSKEDLLKLIDEKVRELGGLLKEEGAALLIARELGVPVPREEYIINASRLSLSDLVPGLRNLHLLVRVVGIEGPFETKSGRTLLRLTVSDGTRVATLKIWGEKARGVAELLRPGDCIVVEGAYTKRYRGKIELGIADNGRISKLPEEDCSSLPSLEDMVKELEDVLVLDVYDVKRDEDLVTILGVAIDGRTALLHLRCPLPHIEQGDRIVALNIVKTIDSDEFLQAYGGRRISVFPVSRHKRPRISTLSISQIARGPSQDRGLVRGFFLACLPREKGGLSIYVGDRDSYLEITVFGNEGGQRFLGFDFGDEIVLGPLRHWTGGFKLPSHFYVARAGGRLPVKDVSRTYIRGARGNILVSAAIVSASLGVAVYPYGTLAAIRLVLDDSTDQAVAVSSDYKIFEQITRIPRDELTDYYKEGALKGILEYVQETLVGRECEIEGYSYGRFIALRSIRALR